MIATPTTITAMMPALRPRLLRTILLRGDGAFFDGAGPFFPFSFCVVLVLNWLLLYCVCVFRLDGCSRSWWFYRFLAIVCSRPDLPECVPGKPTKEDEEDEHAHPVWNPGEGVGHDLADMLQARGQLYLPVRQWRHGRVGQPDPQHAPPDECEQDAAGQVRCGERVCERTQPPGECAGPEQAACPPVVAIPEQRDDEQRSDHAKDIGRAKHQREPERRNRTGEGDHPSKHGRAARTRHTGEDAERIDAEDPGFAPGTPARHREMNLTAEQHISS